MLHQKLGLSNCPLPAMILKANTAWSPHSYLAYTPRAMLQIAFLCSEGFHKAGVLTLERYKTHANLKRSHLSRRKAIIYIRRRWSKNLHQTFNVGILPMSLLGFLLWVLTTSAVWNKKKWVTKSYAPQNYQLAPENGWLEDDPFLLGKPIFRGYVRFRDVWIYKH